MFSYSYFTIISYRYDSNYALSKSAIFTFFGKSGILQTIMEDDKLIVTDVIFQSSKRNLYGRSVRLDALCTLGNGTLCNIEVQRSDNDDHLRRARYNASVITSKETEIQELL